MKSQVTPNAAPKTDEEYQAEADRLIAEIRAMLDSAKRSTDAAKRIRAENLRMIEALEKRLLCGND